MWLIKSEDSLFKSIRRYLIHIKKIDKSKIVHDVYDHKNGYKTILLQFDGNAISFFELLSQLQDEINTDKFIILGEKSDVEKRLKIFLKDNNKIEIVEHLELIERLKNLELKSDN